MEIGASLALSWWWKERARWVCSWSRCPSQENDLSLGNLAFWFLVREQRGSKSVLEADSLFQFSSFFIDVSVAKESMLLPLYPNNSITLKFENATKIQRILLSNMQWALTTFISLILTYFCLWTSLFLTAFLNLSPFIRYFLNVLKILTDIIKFFIETRNFLWFFPHLPTLPMYFLLKGQVV